ncbi:MAG: hypothetical protein ACTSXT_07790 [Candidatus Helarchaeota archaeon]
MISELRSFGILDFDKLAIDSFQIESYFRLFTKKRTVLILMLFGTFQMIKERGILGTKLIITDIDGNLNISCIITRASELNQKITDSLINL